MGLSVAEEPFASTMRSCLCLLKIKIVFVRGEKKETEEVKVAATLFTLLGEKKRRVRSSL